MSDRPTPRELRLHEGELQMMVGDEWAPIALNSIEADRIVANQIEDPDGSLRGMTDALVRDLQRETKP